MLIGQIELFASVIENGIIAAAFLYILYWLLNKHTDEMQTNARRSHLASLEVARSLRELTNIVLSMQQQLLTHDLTTSGLHPGSEEELENRDMLAFRKYNEVMEAIEEQKARIRKNNETADQRIRDITAMI